MGKSRPTVSDLAKALQNADPVHLLSLDKDNIEGIAHILFDQDKGIFKLLEDMKPWGEEKLSEIFNEKLFCMNQSFVNDLDAKLAEIENHNMVQEIIDNLSNPEQEGGTKKPLTFAGENEVLDLAEKIFE